VLSREAPAHAALRWRTGIACACVTLSIVFSAAQRVEAFEIPALRGHVNDYAQLLSPRAAFILERRLSAFEAKTGHQFALLTVPSLEGAPIETYAIKVAESWKLGSEQADDGLILVVAKYDRRMRIEVGQGLEGDIPDAVAARVIREVLTPAFRDEDYAAGIEAAFNVLTRAAGAGGSFAAGQSIAQPQSRAPDHLRRTVSLLLVVFLFCLALLKAVWDAARGEGVSWRNVELNGGGGSGSSWSTGSHDSQNSDSGYSGGGGGFGGGGASGSW
jgi:uncharacterized protein